MEKFQLYYKEIQTQRILGFILFTSGLVT